MRLIKDNYYNGSGFKNNLFKKKKEKKTSHAYRKSLSLPILERRPRKKKVKQVKKEKVSCFCFTLNTRVCEYFYYQIYSAEVGKSLNF